MDYNSKDFEDNLSDDETQDKDKPILENKKDEETKQKKMYTDEPYKA